MNNAVKCVISAVGGFALGAAGAYIYLKKRFSDSYYAELTAAIDQECENIRRMNSELTPLGSTRDVVREEKTYTAKTPSVPDPHDVKEQINTRVVDYGSYFAGTNQASPPDDDEDEVDPAETEFPQEDDPESPPLFEDKDPEFMYEQDFLCIPDRYQLAEWGLCVKDGTLVDENDEMVDNPYHYVKDLLDDIPLAIHNGDIVGDTAYILCEREGMAIEVHLYNITYAELTGDQL